MADPNEARTDCVLRLGPADTYVYDMHDNVMQLKADALKDYPLQ